MIPKESALRILAVIEEEREKENAASPTGKSLSDFSYRLIAAHIAKASGYTCRDEWMDELRRMNQNV